MTSLQMTNAPIDTTPTKQIRELTLSDRCDRCGETSQAFYMLYDSKTLDEKLLLCRHHYMKHEAGLLAMGWAVLDNSDKLNERPTANGTDG